MNIFNAYELCAPFMFIFCRKQNIEIETIFHSIE